MHAIHGYRPSNVNMKAMDWDTGSMEVVVLKTANVECL